MHQDQPVIFFQIFDDPGYAHNRIFVQVFINGNIINIQNLFDVQFFCFRMLYQINMVRFIYSRDCFVIGDSKSM